jgi:Holliday junction resolvase RusA-like endonuclease
MMTAPVLYIYVGGAPKGQPRGRHVPAGKGKFRVVSTADPRIAAYRTRLIAVMKQEAKRQDWKPPELVRVDIAAYFATKDAERWGHYCGKKPDRDNIDKLILDCAGAKNGAGLFKDDACVAAGGVMKVWSKLGGVLIELKSLDAVIPQQDDDDDLGALREQGSGPGGEPFGLERLLAEPEPEPDLEGNMGDINREPHPIWRRIHKGFMPFHR